MVLLCMICSSTHFGHGNITFIVAIRNKFTAVCFSISEELCMPKCLWKCYHWTGNAVGTLETQIGRELCGTYMPKMRWRWLSQWAVKQLWLWPDSCRSLAFISLSWRENKCVPLDLSEWVLNLENRSLTQVTETESYSLSVISHSWVLERKTGWMPLRKVLLYCQNFMLWICLLDFSKHTWDHDKVTMHGERKASRLSKENWTLCLNSLVPGDPKHHCSPSWNLREGLLQGGADGSLKTPHLFLQHWNV